MNENPAFDTPTYKHLTTWLEQADREKLDAMLFFVKKRIRENTKGPPDLPNTTIYPPPNNEAIMKWLINGPSNDFIKLHNWPWAVWMQTIMDIVTSFGPRLVDVRDDR